jgi:putative hemolysin
MSAVVLSMTVDEGWLALGIVLFLLLMNGLVHLAEGALSGLKRSRIRALAEERDSRAPVLQSLADESPRHQATCHVLSHLLRAGIFCASAFSAVAFGASLLPQENGIGVALAVVMTVLLVAVVNVAVFELPLRGYGRKHSETWALRLRLFLLLARALASPFVFLVEGLGGFFAARLRTEPLFSAPVLTEEDLREMVESMNTASDLVEDEREMIHSIIEFGDTVAREVMTPRTDVHAVEVNASIQEVAEVIRSSGHTRIPVYRDTIDNIVGIVHAKDILAALANGNGARLSDLMRPALFIPESKSLQQLLAEFRSGKTQMAVVQDEFGGTAGVVTIEDLVEEIVGEIVDEYDEEEPEIIKLADGRFSVDGRMNLDDLNGEVGLSIHSDEYDTLGGFVFGLFGRQPQQGESVVWEGWRLVVENTDGRRVRRVLIERLPQEEEGEVASRVP